MDSTGKRIALAMEKFQRFAGGAESYAVALAGSLLAAGWKVDCIGRQWGGEPAGARFIEIKEPRFLPTWARMLHFALRHRRIVSEGRYDVVVGFGNTIAMNLYQSHGGVHWASTFRKVYSEPNPWLRTAKRLLILLTPKNWMRSWIESAPFRLQPRPVIVAISDLVREDIRRVHGLGRGEVELVYNGIDLDRFTAAAAASEARLAIRSRYGFSPADTVFLFVSFELKKKGMEPLLAALRLLTERNRREAKLLVVGGLPSRKMQRYIDRHGLAGTISFAGPQQVIGDFYAAGDAFILPTYYDACSLSVLEAMASGLPPITTESNGIAGILENGRDGIVLHHPPDPEEIAGAMTSLLDGPGRQAMGSRALATARRYSIRENHRRMLELCARAASRPY
ncbi:MAG: glycosyltransferase family 4 protein, partial [Thermodesulfobacteriota bacterium]